MAKPKDAARKAAERFVKWSFSGIPPTEEEEVIALARALRAARRAGAKEASNAVIKRALDLIAEKMCADEDCGHTDCLAFDTAIGLLARARGSQR